STILWRETADETKLLSANIAWAAIDEATLVSDEFYDTITSRLGRHTLPDGTKPPRKLLWASNPGPGWCKRLFPVGSKPRKSTQTLTDRDGNAVEYVRAFVPALPRDNPHLSPDYEARLRANHPAIWVRRFLDGDWDAFE